MNLEFEILEYKNSIAKDKQAMDAHQKEINKPVPKMQVINIPKLDNSLPQMISQADKEALCHNCNL